MKICNISTTVAAAAAAAFRRETARIESDDVVSSE